MPSSSFPVARRLLHRSASMLISSHLHISLPANDGMTKSKKNSRKKIPRPINFMDSQEKWKKHANEIEFIRFVCRTLNQSKIMRRWKNSLSRGVANRNNLIYDVNACAASGKWKTHFVACPKRTLSRNVINKTMASAECVLSPAHTYARNVNSRWFFLFLFLFFFSLSHHRGTTGYYSMATTSVPH